MTKRICSLLADVDMGAYPAIDDRIRIAERNDARQKRSMLSIFAAQWQLHLQRRSGFQRLRPLPSHYAAHCRGENSLPVAFYDFSGREARIFVPMTVKPKDFAVSFGHPDELRNGIRQHMELPLTGPERRFRAFAFGDLLGRNVDAHDLAIGIA
jgi:hypothetical protein